MKRKKPTKIKKPPVVTKVGLSPKNFKKLRDEVNAYQFGECAICRKKPTAGKRAFALDHCHASGNIRGILCQQCNTGLGMFNDNVDLLAAAIEYLESRETGRHCWGKVVYE